ncbi:2-keto-4-pentenoate hydratase [Lacisediminimonas profundi]|uniref:2-keto-4-pentenoate hydratase n=1 Tax=Lacisediminimonas profundi TaxID=2603856 RepID=UPI00124B8B43|nr:4-oxalocrotonate decarboxylase [Lacisediminimonas profundi]
MLVASQASRYAHQLLDARADSRQLSPLTDDAPLSIGDAYDIAKTILDVRVAQGEMMVGRKLGFTNRTIWPNYGEHEPIKAPIWGPMFDTTVRYAQGNAGVQSLAGAVQPRLEPEVVFKLGRTPGPDCRMEELADCIEWMAHAFEIVACPFPGWKFEAADAIAAFGLHGTLIVGEPASIAPRARRKLAGVLSNASVSLSCSRNGTFSLRAAGFGSDVLDSPVHALWHAHQLLKTQPQFPPLAAGEIISTGTWTDAWPIEPGQTWTSAFSGVLLPGLAVSFV